MFFLVVIISIFIFIKTLSYGIYEIKNNSNTIGGITVIITGLFSVLVPTIAIFIKGF